MADETWFERLYQGSYRRLVLTAYGMTGDLGAAEEITQEAFAIAYGKRGKVSRTDSPEAWLRTVVVNLARRRYRRKITLDRILRRAHAEPLPGEERVGEHLDLHDAIKELGAEYRAVVVLHYLADLPVDEVAALLGAPVGTVKCRGRGPRSPSGCARRWTMSELDTLLAALRDDLRTAIAPPDLAEIGDRARQRTARRRMQVGAVAAVVAASVVVPVLRSVPGDPPLTDALPASMTFELDFADADHAYALGSDCEYPDGPCEFVLLATDDGGRSWARRTLPDDDVVSEPVRLMVIDASRLIVDLTPSGTATSHRFISADRGRTWRDVGWGVLTAPAQIPGNAPIEQMCVDKPTSNDCRFGIAVLSSDGKRVVPTPGQPPLIELRPGGLATEGGHYWVAGIEEASGRWAISVSSDRGATWATTRLSLPGEPGMIDAWAVVESDGVLYATLQGSIANGPIGLLAVFRSTDGGQSWTNPWRATPDTVLQAVLGGPVATADGRLLVYSAATGTYESRDDGRTFTKAARQLPGPVTWTRGGYVAEGQDGGYAISADGIDWRTFEIR
jgi:RNA polymerase sigma-70 factor (ECF subfamily)